MKRLFLFVGMVFLLKFNQSMWGQEIQKEFTAQMFGDFYYNFQRDTLSTTLNYANLNDPVNMNGLIFRRINAGYNFHLSSRISTKIVWEADNVTFATNNKLSFFPKDACISFDSLKKTLRVNFGIIQTPVFIVSEQWWGHRFLEKTITDLYGFVSSRDMGISLHGRCFKNRIMFALMVGNGNGIKLENDRFKTMYFLMEYQPFENFKLALSGAYYFQKRIIDLYDSIPPIRRLNKDDMLVTLFVGYKKKKFFSAGLELFAYFNQHDYNTGKDFVSYFALGSSTYFNLSPFKRWTFVGRLDFFEPNDHTLARNDLRIYMVLASDYHVRQDMIISPNFIVEFYDKTSTGKTIKPGITGRITFSWRY